MRARQSLALLVALFVLGVLLSASASHRVPQALDVATATETVFVLDPEQSKVHWILGSTLHAVHGTFSLKRGIVRVDPGTGKAAGEIVADATSGESGNGSRDKRMHKEILESSRYNEVVFRPDRVEGKIPAREAGAVQLHGMLLLHGSEHELVVPVRTEVAEDHWKGNAKFSVPYIAWGLKNPSNFLLRVDPAVQIELEMAGRVERGP
jgi:polyisoprenoid-binding protein YceI